MIGVGEGFVDHHADKQAMRLQQTGQVFALVVEDVEADISRHPHHDFAAAVEGFHLHRPQGGQGARLHRANASGAATMGADLRRALQNAAAPSLTAYLHQAERGNPAHLNAGAVRRQTVLEHFFDGAVVLGLIHVDEVDDDQTGQVAQAQLPRGFLGRLHVGLQRGRFDIALAGRLAGIDIDGDQGLGLVDHQIAAGFERHVR